MKLINIIKIPLRVVFSPLLHDTSEKSMLSVFRTLFLCAFFGSIAVGLGMLAAKIFGYDLFEGWRNLLALGSLFGYSVFSLVYHIESDLFANPVKQLHHFKLWLLK